MALNRDFNTLVVAGNPLASANCKPYVVSTSTTCQSANTAGDPDEVPPGQPDEVPPMDPRPPGELPVPDQPDELPPGQPNEVSPDQPSELPQPGDAQ